VADRAASSAGAQGGATAGCTFADRCPSVTSPCRQTTPPLFRTDRHRAVSCYLYQGAPRLTGDEMGSAFAEPARPESTGQPDTPTSPVSTS
jgi:hypothetical protein